MDDLKQKKHREQKVAILIVWTVISVATAIIVIFPFFADRKTVLKSSPTCISKKQFNVECSLCGMVRAFIEISNGNFSNAYDLNKGSLFVYSSFVLNLVTFIAYIIYNTKTGGILRRHLNNL